MRRYILSVLTGRLSTTVSPSLPPFLTERFSEIHLFDLRYNLTSVKSYVEEHDIDAVVVLYSFSNFVTGTNLFALGR